MLLLDILGLYDIAISKKKIEAELYSWMSAPLSVEKGVKSNGVSSDHASKFLTLNGLKHETVERVLERCFRQPLDR